MFFPTSSPLRYAMWRSRLTRYIKELKADLTPFASLVRLPDGVVATAEVHWYEASGIGKKEFKVKRLFWD
jgi:hypothetical protein